MGKITEQLKQAIRESGKSRYRICRDCNLDDSILYRFMANECGITLTTADKLCEYFDLQLNKTTPEETK